MIEIICFSLAAFSVGIVRIGQRVKSAVKIARHDLKLQHSKRGD